MRKIYVAVSPFIKTCRAFRTKNVRKTFAAFFLAFILMSAGNKSWGQTATDGDYRTRSTGALNWSGATTWQVRASSSWSNTATAPSSTANVYIQAGSTVTVDVATATCNDISINQTSGVLTIGANTVQASGKLRGYTGTAVFTTGADGTFYSGQAASTNATSTSITSTAGSGKLSFVGNSRAITVTGEWGATSTGVDIDISLTTGQTATPGTNMKAANWTMTSGILDCSTTARVLSADNGTVGGNVTISSGFVFISAGSPVLQRTGSTSGATLNLNSGATLRLTALSPAIAMTTLNLNGTVEYSRATAQTWAVATQGGANPNTYNNVTLSGGGVKTLGMSTTVNGTLSLQGIASLALSTFTLTYGASSTLEYAGSAQQTATATEFPASGSLPTNLQINNSSGFLFPASFSRTVAGNWKVLAGDVQVAASGAVTITMTGATPSLQVDGSITGTNVGGGKDINLIYSNTTGTITVSGSGSLCRFLNTTVSNSGATMILSRTLETMFGIFTENGILQLNSGGTISSAASAVAPTYGASSKLVYNQGGTPTFGNEWTANGATAGSTAGLGIPNNVTIQNSTTVNMPNSDRGMAGSLNIVSGTLSLNGTSGDLYVAGDWTDAGTFNPANRAVFFNGSSSKTITKTGGETFDYFIVNKPSATIQLGSNVTINSSKSLTFTNGTITLNGFDFILNSGATFGSNSTSKYFVTNSTGQLKQTVAGSPITFPVGNSSYNPITLTNSGTSDTYGILVLDGTVSNAIDPTYCVNRRWQVTEGTSGGGNLAVAAVYNTADGAGVNYSGVGTLQMGLFVPSAWTANSATSSGGSSPFTVTTGANFTNALSGASQFAIGNTAAFAVAAPTINASGGVVASSPGSGTSGYVGNTITINGTNLNLVTVVKVGGSGGTSVTITGQTATTLTFVAINLGGQIYVQNSGGNATSTETYTNLGYITQSGATTWATNASWLGGLAPVAGATTTVAHNLTVSTAIAASPATITVNGSVILDVNNSGGSITATTSVTNNGTVTFSNTGSLTTPLFTNGSLLSWSAAGTLNISAGGTLANNATFTRGSGTVNFVGAGTINGTTAITLNNLTINTGGLTLSTVPTIDGIFTINNGNVNQSPIYSSNSTLFYNVSYGRYLEWGANGVQTIGTTPGYPNNVTINAGTFDGSGNSGFGALALNGTLTVNNTAIFNFNAFAANFNAGAISLSAGGTLNMNTLSGGTVTIAGNAAVSGTWNMNSTSDPVNVGGSLSTVSGGTVNMGSMSQPITVTGGITNAGTLTLSSASGGDIKLAGNWNNSGSFNPATRQVEFNSSTAAQTITGATGFDYLKINNSFGTATVTLANNISVSTQLDMSAGKLVLGTNNCTIGSSGSIVNFSATKYINTNNTGRLIQTVAASNKFFPVGKSAYNPLILNNSGTSDTYGVYVIDAVTSPAPNDGTKLVNRFWNVNEGSAGGSNLSVVTQWNSPGEENANFAAGTTAKVGLYTGSGPWTAQLATAGSGTVGSSSIYTSNSNFSPSDLTAGGTFGAGKDDGFLGNPPSVGSFSPTTGYTGTSVVISGSGFTGTSSVTFGGTPAASYTVDNDGQITAVVATGTSGSVVVTNPNGSSSLAGFTYAGYITNTGATTWATPASWLGGAVPPSGATTTIAHDLAVSTAIATAPATITVNGSVTLDVNNSAGSITASTSVTNNGTVTFSNTGSMTTPLFTNAGTLSWSAAGTLNISTGGTLTNNGTFTRGSGNVVTAGAATINGSNAITFNNLTITTGAVTLSTVPTIDGNLQINGGNVTAAPIYTSNSTLTYNTAGAYGRFLEWDATGVGTIGTTAGYPNNVTVNNNAFDLANGSTLARAMNGTFTIAGTTNLNALNATLTIGNGMTINSGGILNSNTTSGAVNITGAVSVAGTWNFNSSSGGATVTGNLTVSGTLNMGTASQPLTVTGFVTNSNVLTLSGTSGGDLYVGGNLTNNGTFTHNSRAVFFTGTTQSVNGSFNSTGVTNGFAFVRINNGTVVTLAANANIDNDLTFNSGKISLSTFNLTLKSTATITSASSSNYVVAGNTGQLKRVVAASAVTFPVGNSSYNPLILANSGTSDTYGVNVIDGAVSTALDATYSINREWQVKENTSLNSNLSVTAQYNTGEENTNYNSGTLDYLGFYNGTAWVEQAATRAGSNPFTVASNSNFNLTAANLTTGTQYFAIGRDGAFTTPPPTISSFTATSGYTGSSIVITGNNFSAATAVSFGGTAAASFTVNSNTQITAVVGAGASGSISVTSPTGTGSLTGFTYLGYITQTGATTWATAASWLGNGVPPAGATTTIAHNLQVSAAVANSPATVTVNSSVSLDINNAAGALTATGSVTNNGTVTFSAAGAMTTPTFTNGGTLSWSAAGTLNISAAGTLTNNGTFTGGPGNVITAGAATINGSNAITFNNLTITTGTVTLSTIPTIDGIFKINGGSITAAPVYTANSTLQYNTTYTRFNEWSATGVGTIGTTAGYPNNVTVSTGTLTVLNADAGTARAMNGNLQVNSGCTFATGVLNAALTIGGSVTIAGAFTTLSNNGAINVTGAVAISGSMTLSSVSPGDLYVGGNFTNSGTFTHNTRAVFFTGTTQSISGANLAGNGALSNNFAYIRINNGTNVTLAAAINVVSNVTFNSGKITLSTFNLTLLSGATITSATSTNFFVTNNTGQLKQVVGGSAVTFPVGNSSYNPIVVTNSGTSDTYGINVVDAAPPAASVAAKTINRYWQVTEASAGGGNLTPVVLQYNTGEEGAGYNAATTPYMGLYNASAWTQTATTIAGSNPFTATSTGSGQFPATIPSGSYFAIGKDDAFGSGSSDFYRSIVTTGNWSTTGSWQSSPDSTNWFTATTFPGTGSHVSIRNGNNITYNTTGINPVWITVDAGGTLTLSNSGNLGSSSTTNVAVNGTLSAPATIVSNANGLAALTLTVTGTGVFNNNVATADAIAVANFTIANGGSYVHNAIGSTANGTVSDFPGSTSRNLGASSNVTINAWGQKTANPPAALPTATYGNLAVNILSATYGGAYTNTSAGWQQSGALNNVAGILSIQSLNGLADLRFNSRTSAASVTLGGLSISTPAAEIIYVSNGGTSNTNTHTFTVNGDLSLSNSANFVLNINNITTNVNLSGDFSLSGTASLTRSGAPAATVNFVKTSGDQNFTTTATGLTGTATNFVVGNGTTTTNRVVMGSNFPVNSGATVTVNSGARLESSTFTVSGGTFNLTSGGTLGIGSPNGINTSGASGNVQTTTRTFSSGANYVFNGAGGQNTGTFTTTATANTVASIEIAGAGTVTNNYGTALSATSLKLTSGTFIVGTGNNINIASTGTIAATSGNFNSSSNGTITFLGTGTVSGTVNFYPGVLQTPGSLLGVDYGAASTIQNYLQLNANSFVNGGVSPTYATNSTLIYNSGSAYSRNVEWAPASSGAGYPYNVTVQNGTSVDISANGGGDHYMGGTLTLGTGTTSNGSLTMNATTSKLTVLGDVIIGGNTTSGTSTLTLSSNATSVGIDVGGNWTRSAQGSFVHNSRGTFFSGAGTQTITGSGGETFAYMLIKKSNGGITLGSDVTVNTNVDFDNGGGTTAGKGIITTGSFKLIIPTTGGFNLAGTKGWVNGNLQRATAGTGSPSYVYPLGTSTDYLEATLAFTGISGAGNVTGTAINGDQTNLSSSAIDPNKSVNAFWRFTNSGVAATSVAPTFNYNTGITDGGVNAATFRIGKYSGAAWTYLSSVTSSTTTASGTVSPLSFGDFAIGNCKTITTATVGADQTICSTTGSVTLSGNAPAAPETGAWSFASGPNTSTAQLSDPTLYDAVFTPTVTGTYKLVWTLSLTTPCSGTAQTSASPNLTIVMNKASVAATALLGATTICNGGSANLSQTGGTLGTGATWNWYTNSSFTGSPVNTNTNADAGFVASPTTTTTYYLRIEGTTAPCTDPASAAISVTITVNQPSTAPTGATASGITLCAAGTVTLTETGGVLGTGASYEWATDPSFASVISHSASFSTAILTTTTYYVRINGGTAPCSTGPTASASVTVVIGNTWLGIDTDWFNVLNWCGGVPTASSDISIPVTITGNYPNISTGNALVHTISILSGASATVSGTGVLSLYGSISNSGTLNITNGTLNLATDGVSVSGGSLYHATVKNLELSGNTSLSATSDDTLKVTGDLFFGAVSNKVFNTYDNLTLVSNAAGTASVDSLVSGNSISGTANVERYIQAGRKWRFLALNTALPALAPALTVQNAWMENQVPAANSGPAGYGMWVTGIAPATGFDAASPGATIKWWDPAGNAYVPITDPTNYDIRQHSPYMVFVRGDRSATGSGAGASVINSTVLRTKGDLIQGTQNTVVPLGNGYIPVNNPYASAIDLTKLSYSTGSPINIAVWDPQLGGTYTLGAFQTLSSNGPGLPFTVVPGGGSYGSATYVDTIESGQGFFIKGSNASRTVGIVETAKTTGNTNYPFFAPGQEQRIQAQLSINSGTAITLVDGALVKFNTGYQTAFDADDATKMTNTSENISIKRDNQLLAVEYRNLPDELDTVQLNMANLRATNYQWKFALSNMDQPGRVAFLVDQYTNTETPLDLTGSTTYDFTVVNLPGSYAVNRFFIVFRPATVVPVTLTSISATRLADKTVLVKWHSENEIAINHYELQRSGNGTQFISIASDQSPTNNAGGSASYSKIDLAPLGGDNYYRIKAISNNGHVQYSAIVKVDPIIKDASISIYPNPISDRVMNLKFAGETPGKYELQLSDKAGRVVYTTTVTITDGNEVKSLNIGDGLRSGGYDLVIIGPDGKKSVMQVVLE